MVYWAIGTTHPSVTDIDTRYKHYKKDYLCRPFIKMQQLNLIVISSESDSTDIDQLMIECGTQFY